MSNIKKFKFAGREGIRIVGDKRHYFGVREPDARAFETYIQPKLGFTGAVLLEQKRYKHSKWVFYKVV